MRSILIGIIIFLIILFFRSLYGPIVVVVKKRGGERRAKEKQDPERINRCMEMLGLKPGASQEEVNQSYRDLVNVWHPDRFADNQRLLERAE